MTTLFLLSLEAGAPNLDSESASWLRSFCDACGSKFDHETYDKHVAVARKLFPEQCETHEQLNQAVQNINLLHSYAYLKAKAIGLRLAGNIPKALLCEELCDDFYKELSEYARW